MRIFRWTWAVMGILSIGLTSIQAQPPTPEGSPDGRVPNAISTTYFIDDPGIVPAAGPSTQPQPGQMPVIVPAPVAMPHEAIQALFNAIVANRGTVRIHIDIELGSKDASVSAKTVSVPPSSADPKTKTALGCFRGACCVKEGCCTKDGCCAMGACSAKENSCCAKNGCCANAACCTKSGCCAKNGCCVGGKGGVAEPTCCCCSAGCCAGCGCCPKKKEKAAVTVPTSSATPSPMNCPVAACCPWAASVGRFLQAVLAGEPVASQGQVGSGQRDGSIGQGGSDGPSSSGGEPVAEEAAEIAPMPMEIRCPQASEVDSWKFLTVDPLEVSLPPSQPPFPSPSPCQSHCQGQLQPKRFKHTPAPTADVSAVTVMDNLDKLAEARRLSLRAQHYLAVGEEQSAKRLLQQVQKLCPGSRTAMIAAEKIRALEAKPASAVRLVSAQEEASSMPNAANADNPHSLDALLRRSWKAAQANDAPTAWVCYQYAALTYPQTFSAHPLHAPLTTQLKAMGCLVSCTKADGTVGRVEVYPALGPVTPAQPRPRYEVEVIPAILPDDSDSVEAFVAPEAMKPEPAVDDAYEVEVWVAPEAMKPTPSDEFAADRPQQLSWSQVRDALRTAIHELTRLEFGYSSHQGWRMQFMLSSPTLLPE